MNKNSYFARLKIDIKRKKVEYLLFLPVLIYFIIFCYVPLYGIFMAFFDYVPALGFAGSEYVGFQWFSLFFDSIFFHTVFVSNIMFEKRQSIERLRYLRQNQVIGTDQFGQIRAS